MRLVHGDVEAIAELLVGIVLRQHVVLGEHIGERIRAVACDDAVLQQRQRPRPDVATGGTKLLLALKADVVGVHGYHRVCGAEVDHLYLLLVQHLEEQGVVLVAAEIHRDDVADTAGVVGALSAQEYIVQSPGEGIRQHPGQGSFAVLLGEYQHSVVVVALDVDIRAVVQVRSQHAYLGGFDTVQPVLGIDLAESVLADQGVAVGEGVFTGHCAGGDGEYAAAVVCGNAQLPVIIVEGVVVGRHDSTACGIREGVVQAVAVESHGQRIRLPGEHQLSAGGRGYLAQGQLGVKVAVLVGGGQEKSHRVVHEGGQTVEQLVLQREVRANDHHRRGSHEDKAGLPVLRYLACEHDDSDNESRSDCDNAASCRRANHQEHRHGVENDAEHALELVLGVHGHNCQQRHRKSGEAAHVVAVVERAVGELSGGVESVGGEVAAQGAVGD